MRLSSSEPTKDSPRGKWGGRIARGMAGLILAVCLTGAVREEIGTWWAHAGTLEGYRRAEKWDPGNPAYPAAIARLQAAGVETADAQLMARELEKAARLGPDRAINWSNLAEAYGQEGGNAEAERSFERALEIFPKSPEINWQYANYLVRTGYAECASRALEETILGDAGMREAAFDLAWRGGLGEANILDLIPAKQEILSAYLDYLVRTERLEAAAKVWERLAASPEKFDMDAAFRYFDALREAHQVNAMWTVWTDLARHDPEKIRWEPERTNLLQNGSFEWPMLDGGFGWRAVPSEDATIALDAATAEDGRQSLEITFDGKSNVEFGNVAQYVAVEPSTRYHFDAYERTEGITTDSGPRITIYDAYERESVSVETANLVGTRAWTEQAATFETGPETRLIVVQVVRPRSLKLDNQIAGTIWLDHCRLTKIR